MLGGVLLRLGRLRGNWFRRTRVPRADACNSPRAVADDSQVFLIVFSLEMACKIIAMGFILNKGAYLRDSVGVGSRLTPTPPLLPPCHPIGCGTLSLRRNRAAATPYQNRVFDFLKLSCPAGVTPPLSCDVGA